VSGLARSWTAGRAARRLPWALAAAAMVAAAIAAGRVEPRSLPVGGAEARVAVLLIGALAGWWVARGSAELRRRIELDDAELAWIDGERRSALPLGDIDALGWDPPLSSRRRWVPAMTLVDRLGRVHRVPALLEDGDALVRDLVARAGDLHHVEAWARTLGLERRMGRIRCRLAVGYAVAALVPLAALVFRVGG